MRRLRLAALLAVATPAMAAVPSLGQTAPGAAFKLDVPKSCVAGECSVNLTYDTAQAAGPVTVEIDWDHAGPPEVGFVARSRMECNVDPAYPEPCTDSSPAYRTAGAHQIVLRATDQAGGASALSAQTVTVA